jgi:ankyrin repeat protein
MQDEIARVFAAMSELPDFSGIDLSDINASGTDGDNALHYVVRRGDHSAAKALIEAGIDINRAGDRGFTPLHVACSCGDIEMVRLLVENGTDLFSLSEGDSPFTTARLSRNDRICDFLAPLMRQMQAQDPNVWLKARLAQLRREIARLELRLTAPDSPA